MNNTNKAYVRAFDTIRYDVLWTKLREETDVPCQVASVLEYWYYNQRNVVKWAGMHSEMYGLECGVRQGGLTSPRLFNLYMNGLLGELRNSNIGCYVEGICVNKISYADDMVSDNLSDDEYLERERRALAVRCNMLARRFARCTDSVKVALFKAYCQSFYTCSLWVRYTRRAYNALRVQYNNAFRVLPKLPRYCSASEMFTTRRVESFNAIIRKRCASMLRRLRTSSNGILSTLADRWDSAILRHWIRLHSD
ncbi:uncharacterized protein LOC123663935 [Melitaea cinxia]|uniref:uncharacterized protein LOC123663935 n=1 Tax=Melitaea cinxia TaxID=113334 RepID=UPI001E27061B|nr:uncharacterized protein LOC123663935 [Melitaea cinxia]